MSWAAYQQHVQHEETSFDKAVRRKLNGEQPTFTTAEDFLEQASPEELKAAINKATQTDREKADAQRSQQDGDAFTKLHKEYVDNGKNARQLRAFCKATYNTDFPNLLQMENAFNALRQNNLIEINERELARRANSEAESRANTIREEAFNAEEAETLSMDELRRRAVTGGGWIL